MTSVENNHTKWHKSTTDTRSWSEYSFRNCENGSFNICETVTGYSHQTISDLNMNFSSWSFCWLMAELWKFQTFFLSLFMLFNFFSFYTGFKLRNPPVTQRLFPILLTVPIKQELLIAFTFPIIITTVCQLKVEFQAFCQFWKIINLNRILEGYNSDGSRKCCD